MATRVKHRDKYLSRVHITKNKQKKIVYVDLYTSDKTTATRRNKIVTRKEHKLRREIRENVSTFDNLYNINTYYDWSWINPNGESTQVREESVEDVVKKYIQHCKLKNKRQTTIDSYQVGLDKFSASINTPIEDIRTEHIDKFIEECIDNKNKKVSVNSYLKTIRAFLNWCIKRNKLNNMPIIDFFEVVKKDKWLTEKEYNAILDYDNYSDERYPKMFKCYAELGLRLQEGFLGEITEDSLGIWLVVSSENEKGKKTKSIRLNEEQRDTIHLIQSKWNGSISQIKYYSRIFKRVRDILNISDHKSFHSLRHYFGKTELIKRGNIYEVSGLLGHHDISITQESYVRSYDERQSLEDFPSLKKYMQNTPKNTKCIPKSVYQSGLVA